MPKDEQTADLFEADGVTPKAPEAKSAPTEGEIKALERAARAEGEAAGLKTAIKAKPAAPAKTEKTFTLAELRAQVLNGDITEDQKDEIWTKQLRSEITTEVKSTVAAETTHAKITGDIARYVEAFPAINTEGSALRAKVQAEFDELVKLGDPADSLATEYKAIKMACGPLKIGVGRRPAPDSHEDVGGDGDDAGKPEQAGWAKGLKPAMKAHYERLVNNGVYKGFADPKLVAELKIARGRPH